MTTQNSTTDTEAAAQAMKEKIAAAIKAGCLIEAGWLSYLEKVVPATAGAVQVEETRRAFFAGAAQLFHDINTGLDADDEPTENDIKRMDAINAELQAFAPKVVG